MAEQPSNDAAQIQRWLDEHRITEVECLIPDMAGQARGEDWPPPQSADPLAEELARVSRAVPILRDETALRETLVWDAGYRDGFAEVARPWD